jgi:hypothetical protein
MNEGAVGVRAISAKSASISARISVVPSFSAHRTARINFPRAVAAHVTGLTAFKAVEVAAIPTTTTSISTAFTSMAPSTWAALHCRPAGTSVLFFLVRHGILGFFGLLKQSAVKGKKCEERPMQDVQR